MTLLKYPSWFMLLASGALAADSNVDPAHKFAWSENAGWTNWRGEATPGQGIFVGPTFLAGFIWSENAGWINLGDGSPADGEFYANVDGTDFGVNLDPDTGALFGYAWGENVGWVNLDTSAVSPDDATFDACEHAFFGYAWGENIGWINLSDATHFVAAGPCDFGDYDCDGDADLSDWEAFSVVMSGPDVAVECSIFDADEDGDVDLFDAAVFTVVFDG